MKTSRRLTKWVAASPVAVLFLLSPLYGELLSSSSPLPGFLLAWLPLAALYGAGALLIREAAVRWRCGWLGIFLLGAAYGIIEEGIVVRSFFDPGWEDLGLLAEYGRSGGVNWVWTILLTIFHSAVSIAGAIATVEIAFPERRHQPWLGNRGLALAAAGVGGWVILGDAAFMDATGGQLAAAAAVVGILVAAARHLSVPTRERARDLPAPHRFFWLSFITSAIVFLFPHAAAEAGSPPPQVSIAVMFAAVAVAALLFWRWTGGAPTTDLHRSRLVGGMLVFLGALVVVTGPAPIVIATSLASIALIWRMMRRVGQGTPEVVGS